MIRLHLHRIHLHRTLFTIAAIGGLAAAGLAAPRVAVAQTPGQAPESGHAALVAGINAAYGTSFDVPGVDIPGQAVRPADPMAPNTPARAGGTNG